MYGKIGIAGKEKGFVRFIFSSGGCLRHVFKYGMQGRMQMSTRIEISLWPEEETAFPHLCGNPSGTKGTSDFARADKGTENEKRYCSRVIKTIRTIEMRR